jgi:hypothetical protein
LDGAVKLASDVSHATPGPTIAFSVAVIGAPFG